MKWILWISVPIVLGLAVFGGMVFRYLSSGEASAKHDDSIFQSIEYRNRGRQAPKRPSKVPQDSVWVGGVDGGVWIQILSFEKVRANLAIYDDFSGKRLAEKVFEAAPGCELTSVKELHSVYAGYDGEQVLLNKSNPTLPGHICSMKAIR